MKNFLIIIFILAFTLVGCSNNSSQNNNKESTNYNASKTATTNDIKNQNDITITDPEVKKFVETEISSFSTKIYTPNDEARQNNITLTCSKLNGTIVKSRRNVFFL